MQAAIQAQTPKQYLMSAYNEVCVRADKTNSSKKLKQLNWLKRELQIASVDNQKAESFNVAA